MLEVKAYETELTYQFIVNEVADAGIVPERELLSFTYDFVKQVPAGQTKTQYLQSCKSTSLGLAQYELDKLSPPKEIEI